MEELLILATSETQGFVSIDVWTMIFTLGNLLILFLVLKKFFFEKIRKVMLDRENEVQAMYDDASKSQEEGLRLKEEYEVKLSEANAESEDIVRNAVRKAQLKEEEIIKDAHAQASAIMKHAETQIELEKKNAVNEIKNDISGMAVDIAAKVIERDINAEDHSALIDEFIDNMGDES
ncbi:MAG: F0F1 ATP synthase subunit B [Ruminococcaceae bacterium]|nr:F0F1 ATP synthase subunit B [Oscillospiraceae bacterium]